MEDRNDEEVASVASKLTSSTLSSSAAMSSMQAHFPPMMTNGTIVVSSAAGNKLPRPPESQHRAVHQIRFSALSHNYACVESAANRQRCSVIVVVKADGYGHGAIATALHLADNCGADAFAVATLEEAIALRKALVATRRPLVATNTATASSSTMDLFRAPDILPVLDGTESISMSRSEASWNNRSRRPPHVRILVLGPPVGFPRCFDDYLYHNIEVMVSGPEVASSLLEWVANADERKRTLVERAARDAKEQALSAFPLPRDVPRLASREYLDDESKTKSAETFKRADSVLDISVSKTPHPAATLSNVSGQDLAKEVRAILMNQQAVASKPTSQNNSGRNTPSINGSIHGKVKPDSPVDGTTTVSSGPHGKPHVAEIFGGIEAVAKDSRIRQMAASKTVFVEDDSSSSSGTSPAPPGKSKSESEVSVLANNARTMATRVLRQRKLRWHALVDSGMGRLGFKTEPVSAGDTTGRRDTVAILKDMVDAEVHDEAPIEFFGMCTHMAEANSSSDYTASQIARFKSLLKRVRNADISVPTVSTDNSAALLTTNLTHFEPDELLSQPHSHTRGFVRTGGAIYGQRPAFTQLRAVSTLKASVRHVAVLKAGESVGYDRAYIAPYDVRIATLTIGFADGYPRELGNGVGKVAIRYAAFPVAGNVCMDMLMVELGPAEEVGGIGASVVVGDTAVLWGPETEEDGEGLVRLQDLAASLRTTQSALTCGLNMTRVSRDYAP